MELLISLLLFLGVINSSDQINESNQQQYQQEYANEENMELYRQTVPEQVETF